MALENKLGITDSAELAREEEKIKEKARRKRCRCLKAALSPRCPSARSRL